MQETLVQFIGKMRWRRDRLPTPVFLGLPGGLAGKESACNAGDLSSISGLGRSPGEGKGYPLQYSGLENSMDRIVHGVQRVRHVGDVEVQVRQKEGHLLRTGSDRPSPAESP